MDSVINKVLRAISIGDYSLGVKMAEAIEVSDIWELAHMLIRESLRAMPSEKCIISASSHVNHPTLSGDIRKINTSSQFIFHTNDSNPWVIIDYGEEIPSQCPVYLYNRCQSQEVSERIIGCRFWTSKDNINWDLLEVRLTDDHIYNHSAMEIRQLKEYRYLKIDRIDSSTPIHLSQFMIGEKLFEIEDFLNYLLAHKYNLRIAKNGKILEMAKAGHYISFKVYDDSGLPGINIKRLGQFSNFLIQITNAIHIASEIGIRDIYLPECQRVRDVFPSLSQVALNTHPVTIHIGKIPGGICLEGNFFYDHEFIIGTKPPLRSIVDLFKEHCDFSFAQNQERENSLTIHLRSGDIFEKDIHSGYGQPPLAFYLQSIRHFKPDFVVLVYENESNPVIPALIKYLKEKPLSFRVQSSKILRDDISVLINATSLVIGNGTFANGVIAFSENLRRVYTFNSPLDRGYQGGNFKVENIVIGDNNGQYKKMILSNNWHNTPEQRQLMLSYREEYLSIIHDYESKENNSTTCPEPKSL